MVKVALLIGVSEFADAALANLPAALRDINAVQSVLNDAERGGFDDVRLLENPDRAQMEEAIDALSRDRHKDDSVFSFSTPSWRMQRPEPLIHDRQRQGKASKPSQSWQNLETRHNA